MSTEALIIDPDTREHLARADAIAAFEEIRSLDEHGEIARLILAEVSLLTRKYRCIRRHDVPHIAELAGLLDVFWQEVKEVESRPARIPHQI